MKHSVFISRVPEQAVDLMAFCTQRNWRLCAQSFIQFSSVSFQLPTQWEVIFFPSPRAVSYFFESTLPTILLDKLIACSGGETAKKIEHYTSQPIGFVAEKAGDIEKVRSDFQRWLTNKKVLYVGSNLAQKSVLLHLPEEQGQFLQVYETSYLSKKIIPCTIYIFSSPSNVDSFFMENILPDNAHVIAWGDTTAVALEKRKIFVNHTLNSSQEGEIIEYLTPFN
jgi:uroporphyrinogen-III synthase